MTVNDKKGVGYQMHPFIKELGLKNSEKSVYALIYSFTVGERGLYHGSRKYLAEALDVSVRTVQYALKRLFDKKLIENAVSSDGRYSGIRCAEIKSKKEENHGEKSTEAPKGKTMVISASERGEVHGRYDEVYKRIIEQKYGELSEQEKNTFLMMYKYERGGDQRRFLSFGRAGNVRMTEMQYRRLLELLPTEELVPYFSRFELMLEENTKTGKKFPHSHYKVIKKWIEEDMEV